MHDGRKTSPAQNREKKTCQKNRSRMNGKFIQFNGRLFNGLIHVDKVILISFASRWLGKRIWTREKSSRWAGGKLALQLKWTKVRRRKKMLSAKKIELAGPAPAIQTEAGLTSHQCSRVSWIYFDFFWSLPNFGLCLFTVLVVAAHHHQHCP